MIQLKMRGLTWGTMAQYNDSTVPLRLITSNHTKKGRDRMGVSEDDNV